MLVLVTAKTRCDELVNLVAKELTSTLSNAGSKFERLLAAASILILARSIGLPVVSRWSRCPKRKQLYAGYLQHIVAQLVLSF